MSRQLLGPSWRRRIERLTGATVVAASANGTYWHDFTTSEHRHGRIHATTHEVVWEQECPKFSSCRRLFP